MIVLKKNKKAGEALRIQTKKKGRTEQPTKAPCTPNGTISNYKNGVGSTLL